MLIRRQFARLTTDGIGISNVENSPCLICKLRTGTNMIYLSLRGIETIYFLNLAIFAESTIYYHRVCKFITPLDLKNKSQKNIFTAPY